MPWFLPLFEIIGDFLDVSINSQERLKVGAVNVLTNAGKINVDEGHAVVIENTDSPQEFARSRVHIRNYLIINVDSHRIINWEKRLFGLSLDTTKCQNRKDC